MIFVTLGSQKFQFNRLLKKIDELIDSGIIRDEVFAQVGASDYIPRNYEYKDFLDREEFARQIERSDVVITHGGTGTIIGAIKNGKKVIAVPRLTKYGEHVDDHQVQLLEQFADAEMILACKDEKELEEALQDAQNMIVKSYVSNTDRIMESIDLYLNSI